MTRVRSHLGVVALFAGLTVVWTFPLALHWRTAVPGEPGDNYLLLWNLWWMRHVLASGGAYFHSAYLFFPFGLDMVNQPHTALQTLVSATVFGRLSIIEAQNLCIFASVFANGIAAYALAFDVTGQRRASTLAGIVFGGSPYITAHLMGHFDLLSAWVLPLFALCLRRSLAGGSWRPMVGCGVVLAAAAYTAYYYVVYLGLLAATYLVASWRCVRCTVAARPPSAQHTRWRRAAIALLVADAALLLWIVTTGGGVVHVGGLNVSLRTAQNPLTVAWICGAALALTWWRVRVTLAWPPTDLGRRGAQTLAVAALVFTVLASPLIVEAATLAREGRYVSQRYFWRTSPGGIDVATLVSGHPFNPVTKGVAGALGRAFDVDRIEGVAWLGVVPLWLLIWPRRRWTDTPEAFCWLAVAGVGLAWALGPRLVVGGFDAGLPLPQVLARFVPIVANARVPGRAMVLVYLAVGVLLAQRLDALDGRWRGRAAQWAVIALVAVEYLGAPVPLTRLEQPSIYKRLAAITDGRPVCELPLGIGDGLDVGAGSQAREVMYFATLHGHPLVGGFVGRMPPGAASGYAEMPVVSTLLALSGGQHAAPANGRSGAQPCRYVIINRLTASPELQAYAQAALRLELLADEQGRALYAVRP